MKRFLSLLRLHWDPKPRDRSADLRSGAMGARDVAAGILPAIEPGILPGGNGRVVREVTVIPRLGSGRQDAAFYGSQDGRRYGREPHAKSRTELEIGPPVYG
jgi:hypothetical protein